MTSLSDPPCLTEYEIYVENAVWILHTLSTRECSSNERLRPRGEGVLWYFHTYVGLGHFWGAQNFEIQYFFWFSEKWIFLGGMKNIFWGAWNFWYIFIFLGGGNGRCGARAYLWRIKQSTPLGSPCSVMSTEGPIWMWNKMWILMSWLIKNRFTKSG